MASRLASAVAACIATTAHAQSLSCGPNLCFASGLSTGAVLQRAPQRAALFGSAPIASAGAPLTVALVSAADGSVAQNISTTLTVDGTWKVVLAAMPTGGNYSAVVKLGGATPSSAIISDLTFGDVVFCSGQSNAWLPLWFTFERNATTRAIAQGQYANIRVWRGGLQETVSGPNWVGPAGVEPGSDSGEALTNQWRRPADLLSPNDIRAGEPWLWELPATCFYTVQFLTDLLGAAAPPFGVMTTPVGGTMLEQWSSIATQTQCANITCMCKQKGCDESQPVTAANCPANQNLWLGNVQPFVNITIGLLLWYQGENNLYADAGNYAFGTGYGCLFPKMIAEWRAIWSAVPGTTSPSVPFGFVELADGTDEAWTVSMAGFRWAQTANYGVVPNNAMPRTFMASAHDLGDPWDADACSDLSCCVDKSVPLGPTCVGDHRGEFDRNSTNWFMGCVHPRPKSWVGRRLAQAAFASVYGGAGPATGPVLAGCTLEGSQLTLIFNASLLLGDEVSFSRGATVAAENTALYLLVGNVLPEDAEANHHGAISDYRGTYANGNEVGVTGWVPVAATAGKGHTLVVDVSALASQPTAVRYATGTGGPGAPFQNRQCCGPSLDITLEPCAPASCPLKGAPSGLPGVPFLAKIVAGKCKCLPPQVCDA